MIQTQNVVLIKAGFSIKLNSDFKQVFSERENKPTNFKNDRKASIRLSFVFKRLKSVYKAPQKLFKFLWFLYMQRRRYDACGTYIEYY